MSAVEADQRRRFLMVLWDGGGNVPPQLVIARRLVARGHDVRILAPRVLAARISATGAQFVPYRQAPEHDSTSPEDDLIQDWSTRLPLVGMARARDRTMVDPALAIARDVLSTLEEAPVDVIAADFMLWGGYLGAEKAKLPLAALFHSIWALPTPGLPPFGMGFSRARGPLGHLRDDLFRRMAVRFYGAGLPRLNAARAALDLAPLGSAFDLFAQADRSLILTSHAFDFPAPVLPDGVRYVGPPFDHPSMEARWTGPWAADDQRPLVVVSLSTTFQQQAGTVQRIIDALGMLPVRALVTVGLALDRATFRVPANTVIESYIPHQQVFPQADLVITHGGHGTVITALAHGVPVICLPMGRDQGDIAARVVWHGAGLRLTNRTRPDTLRRAVQRVLAEPHFRDAARRLANDLRHEDGGATAVAELEGLAGAAKANLPVGLPTAASPKVHSA